MNHELTLDQQISLGLARATVHTRASFADNYEPPTSLDTPRFPLTDAGNSLRFSEDHDGELIYVKGLGWHAWDGMRWAQDDDAAWRAAKETARRIRFEASAISDTELSTKVFGHALRSDGSARLEAMIRLASKGEITSMGLVVPMSKLDSNPYALNCLNGTVSLKTGKLHPHAKDRYITHLIPIEYDEHAEAPHWRKAVLAMCGGDLELSDYVQRAAGYTSTGTPNPEKCFFLPYGFGDNGKTLFVETLKRVMGELGRVAAPDTFISNRPPAIQNDLAALHNARMVVVPETEDGDKLARQVIKRVTGTGTISARFLYRESINYTPQFTIWLETNHLPRVPVTDRAAWSRIRVIPFRQVFKRNPSGRERKADPYLAQKLAKELPGILAWVVQGAVAWHKHGMGETPLAVAEATLDYRRENDTIGSFLEQDVEDAADAALLRTELYAAYRDWCGASGHSPVSRRAFGAALKDRGYTEGWRGSERTVVGVKWAG